MERACWMSTCLIRCSPGNVGFINTLVLFVFLKSMLLLVSSVYLYRLTEAWRKIIDGPDMHSDANTLLPKYHALSNGLPLDIFGHVIDMLVDVIT